MNINKPIDILKKHNLIVTPQRISVLLAFKKLKNHLSADNIIKFVKKYNPNTAIGTVYKVLDTFVNKNIISVVESYDDVKKYELIDDKSHHHIYYIDNCKIEDYYDDKLDIILERYLRKKIFSKYNIMNIRLHITVKKKTKK